MVTVLIYVSLGFFWSFHSCPFLARHLTLAIPIIAAVLFFFVISCLLQTSCRDPGILPRATPSEAADLEKRIGERAGPSAVLLCAVCCCTLPAQSFPFCFAPLLSQAKPCACSTAASQAVALYRAEMKESSRHQHPERGAVSGCAAAGGAQSPHSESHCCTRGGRQAERSSSVP